jgi:hypothetical protein
MTTTPGESFLPPFFLYGFAAGFVGCVICFGFARAVLVPKLSTDSFRDRFQSLSTKEARNFYSLVPSAVHALAQVLFHPAWISLGFSLAHSEDPVNYYDDTWPAFFSGVFVGYLVGDFAILGPKHLGAIFSLHHLSASAAWILSNHLRTMQWYSSFLQFCEFSTLFLNYRQVLLTAGYPSSSSIATMASLGLFLSFFAVRVLPLPGIIYQWITKDFAALHEAHGMTVAAANTVFLTIHVGLQSFWFSLMVQKLVAVAFGKPSKKKEE